MRAISLVGSFLLEVVKRVYRILLAVLPAVWAAVRFFVLSSYLVLLVMVRSLLPEIQELTEVIYDGIDDRFGANMQHIALQLANIGACFIVLVDWIFLSYLTVTILNLIVRGMMKLVGMI